MKIIKAVSCSYAILAMFIWQAPGSGWRGIVPFHSMRTDTERLLGMPSGFCKCQYKTDAENVRIDYSIERCGKGELNNSDVPPDTVLGITLNPETKRPFCELGLDTSKLQKTEDPELHGYVAYTNNEEGIEYYVTDDGKLYEIRYFGTLSDRTKLRCTRK
jgi:hypothetical protein